MRRGGSNCASTAMNGRSGNWRSAGSVTKRSTTDFFRAPSLKTLQQICDFTGPEQIDGVFRKWLKRIPLPLRPEDRRDGYDWDLSIWQMEVSLTQIFDRPLRGGSFSKRSSATTWTSADPTACS